MFLIMYQRLMVFYTKKKLRKACSRPGDIQGMKLS